MPPPELEPVNARWHPGEDDEGKLPARPVARRERAPLYHGLVVCPFEVRPHRATDAEVVSDQKPHPVTAPLPALAEGTLP